MKKLLLYTLCVLLAFQSYGQDPDFVNQTWHLYEVEDTDSGEVTYILGWQPYGGEPEIPQITPYVTVDASLGFVGLGICNTFFGNLEYDGEFYIVTNSSVTDNACGFYEDEAEPYMIGPFGQEGDSAYFNITITDDDDGYKTLYLGAPPFIGYTYRNTPILGIDDKIQFQVSVHPNPTSQKLYVSSEVTITELNIISMEGQKLMSKTKDIGVIDVSALPTGVYFIESIALEGKEIHKFIKN